MKTQVCIFNDRTKVMQLQIQDGDGTGTASRYVSVHPATHVLVDIVLAEGQVPYFKIWETGQALLSSISPSVLKGAQYEEIS